MKGMVSIMKKTVTTAIIGAVLSAALLAGCGSTETSHTVSTDGSTSMEKVIGILSESYSEKHQNVKITYNPTGSSAGISAVGEGRCDIGLSSRALKDDETATYDSAIVAYDGISIIVNTENKIDNLSVSDIADIYTGKITNWSELGGDDLPIVCIGREAASGTRDGFESVTGTKDSCVYTQELTSTGDVIQTVSSNPNAIGYASTASVKDTVKTLSVENVMPANDTILDGSYKISRAFYFITVKGKALSDDAQKFYDFCMSSEADEYIASAGAVPTTK